MTGNEAQYEKIHSTHAALVLMKWPLHDNFRLK